MLGVVATGVNMYGKAGRCKAQRRAYTHLAGAAGPWCNAFTVLVLNRSLTKASATRRRRSRS